MIRNLKALGLALVAMFAMSAVAASMASAEITSAGTFTANVAANQLATIDGAQEGVNTFTLNGLQLTCGTVSLMGNPVLTKAASPDVVEKTTNGGESTDVTLEPTFGPNDCHVVIAGLTKTVTVTTNGCAFVFDAKTTNTKGVITNPALTTVECPTGKSIEIHVYNEKAGEVTTLCTYDVEAIAANTTLPGITLTNKVNTPTSPNEVTADVKVTVTTNNTITNAPCGPSMTEKAVYEGSVTLKGTDPSGNNVDISVSS